MTAPLEHIEESFKKELDAIVELFEITLKKSGAILRFRNGPTITWQDHEYSFWPCTLDKDGDAADDTKVRPNLAIFNPDGALSALADAGEFDLATVVRKEVLQDHLLADVNIYQPRVWFVAKVVDDTRIVVTLELHTSTDIPNFQVPGRFFSPPDFPVVVY